MLVGAWNTIYIYIYWLVVRNMNFMPFHILGIIIPTDEIIFLRGVETTNQYTYIYIYTYIRICICICICIYIYISSGI